MRALSDLFSERSFDPLHDDAGSLWSVAQIARLPDVPSKLEGARLRVLLPASEISPQTQMQIERALARYCAHEIADARMRLAVWRRRAGILLLWSLGFFAVSLLLSAGVQQATVLPEAARTLASETLVIAGWVVMWLPMDELIWGWLPIRDRQRMFRAIGSMRITTEAAPDTGAKEDLAR